MVLDTSSNIAYYDLMKHEKTLGERVKELRLSKEMTQVKATMFFRVSLATIIRLEAGKDCSDLVRAKIEKILSQCEVATTTQG